MHTRCFLQSLTPPLSTTEACKPGEAIPVPENHECAEGMNNRVLTPVQLRATEFGIYQMYPLIVVRIWSCGLEVDLEVDLEATRLVKKSICTSDRPNGIGQGFIANAQYSEWSCNCHARSYSWDPHISTLQITISTSIARSGSPPGPGVMHARRMSSLITYLV